MKVCELTKDHYGELSVFLDDQTQGVISQDAWLDRFSCFWERNPSFKDGSDQRGWLIINAEGRIGGFFGNIPMLYYWKGEERVFNSATSWYVEPSCRRYSLTICRRFLKQDKPKLDTTPTPQVALILKKMGFQSFEAEWLKIPIVIKKNQSVA